MANKILSRHEDEREYHFHQVDREWIIEAMIEFANKVNTKEIGFLKKKITWQEKEIL